MRSCSSIERTRNVLMQCKLQTSCVVCNASLACIPYSVGQFSHVVAEGPIQINWDLIVNWTQLQLASPYPYRVRIYSPSNSLQPVSLPGNPALGLIIIISYYKRQFIIARLAPYVPRVGLLQGLDTSHSYLPHRDMDSWAWSVELSTMQCFQRIHGV